MRTAETSPPLKTGGSVRELNARLGTVIPRLMTEGKVPGLSIVVIRDSKVFWQRPFGVTNAETKQPVTNDTVFEAASLGKPVLAYAVLKLVDSGRMSLDTPLVHYMPGPYVQDDTRLDRITARMVLSHTTGFPNWRPKGGPLKIYFTPGNRFSYSGEGMVFLQKTVEHLTGQPFDALMQSLVFGPLGMTSSSYVWQDRYESLKAFGHDQTGDVTVRRIFKEANAAGSLNTTAADYAKFVVAVMDGTGLKKETARLMLTPQVRVQEGCQECVTQTGPVRLSMSVFWGLGWGLQQTADGKSFWHWGDSGNDGQCHTLAYPKQRVGVLVFTDSGNGHSIIPAIIREAVGGQQPAFAWLNYERYNSPAKRLLWDILARGDTAIRDYRTRSLQRSNSGTLNEAQMNSLGYVLLRKGRRREAIEAFKLNVDKFPHSFDTYDSLGEAYMVKGDKSLAIESYQKSIKLNPKNDNGIEMLKRLQTK